MSAELEKVNPSRSELLDLENRAREVNLRDPDSVTDYWREVWEQDGGKIGLKLHVSDFPDIPKGLAYIEVLGDGPIFVPPEVSMPEKRHLLGQIYLEMSESLTLQEGNAFTNKTDHSGWRYVAVARHSPYLGTNEEEMVAILKVLGAEGIDLSELVIAAKDSQRRTGHYLDERTWSRIPNSRNNDGMVAARFFNPRGRLRVVPGVGLQSRCIHLGFRWSMPVPNLL